MTPEEQEILTLDIVGDGLVRALEYIVVRAHLAGLHADDVAPVLRDVFADLAAWDWQTPAEGEVVTAEEPGVVARLLELERLLALGEES